MHIHILFTMATLRSPGEASLDHYLMAWPAWLVLIDGKCAGVRDHVTVTHLTSTGNQESIFTLSPNTP